MRLKKPYQLKKGDRIKALSRDEYFVITNRWLRFDTGPNGSQVILEWIDVDGIGRVYNKAIKKIFESEQLNYILVFREEEEKCTSLLSMAANLSAPNQIRFLLRSV